MVGFILVIIIAYAIGSINFSVIISKKMAGFDVREKGSGNAGTTNMLRSVGKSAALITLVLDILKGVVAILIAMIIAVFSSSLNNALAVQAAGIFVVLGHTFPIFFNFKGGKGVATAIGVIIMTNWQIGLICLAFGLVLVALTRMVSFGAIISAILYPVLTIFMNTDNYIIPGDKSSYIIAGVILAIIVVFNHRSNIQRILNGQENKISFSK